MGPVRLRRWRWPALVALAVAAAVVGLGTRTGGDDRADHDAPVRRWRCGNETPEERAALDRMARARADLTPAEVERAVRDYARRAAIVRDARQGMTGGAAPSPRSADPRRRF